MSTINEFVIYSVQPAGTDVYEEYGITTKALWKNHQRNPTVEAFPFGTICRINENWLISTYRTGQVATRRRACVTDVDMALKRLITRLAQGEQLSVGDVA